MLKERRKDPQGFLLCQLQQSSLRLHVFKPSLALHLADHTSLPCNTYFPQPHAPSGSLPCCNHTQCPAQLIQIHQL